MQTKMYFIVCSCYKIADIKYSSFPKYLKYTDDFSVCKYAKVCQTFLLLG